jgi:hypothetical protein
MISPEFSIRQFIETVREKDHLEIIHLADKEATEAWRHTYGDKGAAVRKNKSENYQAQLIRLIVCLRSGVQLSRLCDSKERLLNLICCDKRNLRHEELLDSSAKRTISSSPR